MLGCSQRALRDGIAARLPPRGVDLVERASGGGAVLSGPWMVSVSVALPPDHVWATNGLEGYRQLGRLHAVVLSGLGVATMSVPPEGVERGNQRWGGGVRWACFGSLAPWELTDGEGRKVVGLAQRRQGHGVLLVAGTLCHAPDWPLLCDALGFPGDAPWLQRVTVACDALADRAFSAATLVGQLRRALASELWTPRRSSFPV
ncbi:ligase [Hydrogenophaga sp. D2P1]|uniref:Ligase n=1 Tax=Hydrogenophaga aromaticivorans TaxID=2610898 RepID=A0A7Y8GX51_9BURK|nr:ligase [Hydrogenophaga aromaticivorans]NWF45968.1 ligase [Hydrogenophaga aromaticivorans]